MPANQFTVYARHEPTTDSVAIQYLDAKTLATCTDVVVYLSLEEFLCRH